MSLSPEGCFILSQDGEVREDLCQCPPGCALCGNLLGSTLVLRPATRREKERRKPGRIVSRGRF